MFCFDGSFNPETVPYIDEKLLLKFNTTEVEAKMETKEHIKRMPIVQVQDYDRSSTELAICLPLFHSQLDTTPGFDTFDVQRFQDIHVKGAIWAALSMIYNTDIAAHKTPVYFHVEDSVWQFAEPIFLKFNVPDSWIRRISLPVSSVELPKMDMPHYGKKFLPLLDDGIDTDVLAILDSDAYILAQDEPLEFYKKLTSPLFKRRPTTTWFHIKSDIPYFSWVRGCLLATGRPTSDITPKTSLNELEHSCFERMGFADHEIEVVLGHNDNVKRLFCDDYLSTFPKNHPVRDFIVDNIHLNHCPPHSYAIWAYHNELFVQNYDILGVPIYISETDFIKAGTYNCMAHIRTVLEKDGEKSRVDEYYDVFLKHLTLNMPPEFAEKTGAITFHCVSIPHMKIKNGSVNPHTQNVVDTCKALKNAGF